MSDLALVYRGRSWSTAATALDGKTSAPLRASPTGLSPKFRNPVRVAPVEELAADEQHRCECRSRCRDRRARRHGSADGDLARAPAEEVADRTRGRVHGSAIASEHHRVPSLERRQAGKNPVVDWNQIWSQVTVAKPLFSAQRHSVSQWNHDEQRQSQLGFVAHLAREFEKSLHCGV